MDPSRINHPFPFIWTVDSPTKRNEMYDLWSASYDKDHDADLKYIAPMLVAKSLDSLYPQNRQTIKILDVGAGTGLVGVELQKLGFHTIDGMDPSRGMLDMARASRAYTNLYCQFFTSEPTPGLDKDSYDAIVSSGSLIQDHLPADCFIEATRLVKPGGIISMITRAKGTGCFNEPSYRDKFNTVIKQLEEQGKLEEVKWEEVNYNRYFDGLSMTYRVLQ